MQPAELGPEFIEFNNAPKFIAKSFCQFNKLQLQNTKEIRRKTHPAKPPFGKASWPGRQWKWNWIPRRLIMSLCTIDGQVDRRANECDCGTMDGLRENYVTICSRIGSVRNGTERGLSSLVTGEAISPRSMNQLAKRNGNEWNNQLQRQEPSLVSIYLYIFLFLIFFWWPKHSWGVGWHLSTSAFGCLVMS